MRDFQQPGRSAVYSLNGMCATSHPLAAGAAISILEQGGNAVDAAIAATVLLGICEPHMTGLGGDLFALVKPAGDERIVALNGSGRAPAGLDATALRAAGHERMPLDGPLCVTLPGAVDGFCRLSEDYGLLGLDAVLAPAIAAAEQGVPIAPRVAFDFQADAARLKGAAARHFLPWGKAPAVGALFTAPRQAEVLRKIATEGRAGFYHGEVAEDMVASLQAAGGAHSLDDLAATACTYGDPISGDYKGTELVEHPPNGVGATAILMARILAHFDLTTMDPFGADRAHVEAEAAKLAYDARNRFIADPDHASRLAHMLAPETAAKLAALIRMDRALPAAARLTEAVHRDTIYLTVVDRDRMAVSMICSIFSSLGAALASDRFGILFQNRGAGFTLEKDHPNEAGPGKRPMHTILPGMLRRDGKVIMPFGVMGGAYQPNGHARFLTNLVDFGLDLQTAIDAPRSFSFEGSMEVERGYTDAVRAELVERGHRVSVPDKAIGGAQAIHMRPDGVLEGASDPRKDGCALGY